MTCRRIESLTCRKPINAVTRIRGSDDIKGQLHAERLWLWQSLLPTCILNASLHICTNACEKPLLFAGVVLLICVSPIVVH